MKISVGLWPSQFFGIAVPVILSVCLCSRSWATPSARPESPRAPKNTSAPQEFRPLPIKKNPNSEAKKNDSNPKAIRKSAASSPQSQRTPTVGSQREPASLRSRSGVSPRSSSGVASRASVKTQATPSSNRPPLAVAPTARSQPKKSTKQNPPVQRVQRLSNQNRIISKPLAPSASVERPITDGVYFVSLVDKDTGAEYSSSIGIGLSGKLLAVPLDFASLVQKTAMGRPESIAIVVKSGEQQRFAVLDDADVEHNLALLRVGPAELPFGIGTRRISLQLPENGGALRLLWWESARELRGAWAQASVKNNTGGAFQVRWDSSLPKSDFVVLQDSKWLGFVSRRSASTQTWSFLGSLGLRGIQKRSGLGLGFLAGLDSQFAGLQSQLIQQTGMTRDSREPASAGQNPLSMAWRCEPHHPNLPPDLVARLARFESTECRATHRLAGSSLFPFGGWRKTSDLQLMSPFKETDRETLLKLLSTEREQNLTDQLDTSLFQMRRCKDFRVRGEGGAGIVFVQVCSASLKASAQLNDWWLGTLSESQPGSWSLGSVRLSGATLETFQQVLEAALTQSGSGR